jgi:hypothetical protein
MRRSASPLSIRAVRRLLLAALLFLALPTVAEAKPFKVGIGQNAGIAIDDAGTIYVGWQVNVGAPGDAVQFCVVAPKRRSCASQTTIPFPGEGYNRSRVSVLLPAPGVVYVIEPRIITSVGDRTYLARSNDGGRTFGPAVAIAPVGYEQSALGPNGAVAFSAGPTTLRAGLFSPTGGSFRQPGSALGPYLEGTFNDIASNGTQTLAAGSDAGITHAFRLPPGGNPNLPAAWQQIDPARGYREPALASLPGAFAVMLEPVANFAQLAVQRLEPAGWSPPVPIGPAVNNSEFRLTSNVRGRLSAAIDYSAYHMRYATSTDGGVLWSSLVDVVNWGREYVDALQVATNATGAGAAVTYLEFAGDKAVRVARFSPKMAPVVRRKFRGGRVQVRSICDDQKLSLVVEAAKGSRQVKPGSILRRASFARRTKGARRVSRRPYRARYVLRRRHARIPVRVVPRRGKARTLRLKVRGCRRTS